MTPLDELAVPRLFRDAIAADGSRLSEVVVRSGCSARKISKNCQRVRRLLAGSQVTREYATQLAQALRMSLEAVHAAHGRDELVHHHAQRAWEARANEPVMPRVLLEAVLSVIIFNTHRPRPEATREEAIDMARRIARETGHRVFVPAFRNNYLLVTGDGAQIVGSDFGGRLAGKRFGIVDGVISSPGVDR